MKIYNILICTITCTILTGCTKEAAYESIKSMDRMHDRSITEPSEKENESYHDYQKKREEVLKDEEKN